MKIRIITGLLAVLCIMLTACSSKNRNGIYQSLDSGYTYDIDFEKGTYVYTTEDITETGNVLISDDDETVIFSERPNTVYDLYDGFFGRSLGHVAKEDTYNDGKLLNCVFAGYGSLFSDEGILYTCEFRKNGTFEYLELAHYPLKGTYRTQGEVIQVELDDDQGTLTFLNKNGTIVASIFAKQSNQKAVQNKKSVIVEAIGNSANNRTPKSAEVSDVINANTDGSMEDEDVHDELDAAQSNNISKNTTILIDDMAGILDSNDENVLKEEITSLENLIDMNIRVVTTDNKNGMNQREFADSYFDNCVDNCSMTNNGIVILLDMETNTIYFSTGGDMIPLLYDSRLIQMENDFIDTYIDKKDFGNALDIVLGDIEKFYRQDYFEN